ncbi:MAG: RimK/LysX family protein [Gammaproteobacteria bacterium]|nr:RimK/LysX family protein [Gammaproteobacteria bacterium]
MTHKTIGWREWAQLPELEIPHIKVKVDTGARTSALHAFAVETYEEKGVPMVRFALHPLQKRADIERYCTARIIEERVVSDSGGHKEKRYVIATTIKMGDMSWPIEITLTNRDTMSFRMLLGRTAMKGLFLVEPGASYLLGKPSTTELENSYREKL